MDSTLRETTEVEWLCCSFTPTDQQLLSAVQALGSGQRMVFPARCRSLTTPFPENRIEPHEFLLQADEASKWLGTRVGGGFKASMADRAFALSEGWWQPLRWLSSGWQTGSGNLLLPTEELREIFERRILSSLDPILRQLVGELASDHQIDLDIWRLMWLREPEKIVALETLRLGWGLLVPAEGSPGLWRLPRLMKDLVQPIPVSAPRARFAREVLAGRRSQRPTEDAADTVSRRGPAAAVSTPAFDLQLLGSPIVFRLEASGRRVPLEWSLRRSFQTLAYLALAPERRASKEELIEAVWPDVDSDRIRRNFHPTLSVLRRTLGESAPVLRFRQGQYFLDPEVSWQVDVELFETLFFAGEQQEASSPRTALASWRKAWSVYRGPLLGDEDVAWVRRRRDDLRRLYLRMLRRLGELASGLGEKTLAIDALRSVLLEEPFEERIHLAIMELYSSQGRRDLVRRQYVRLQELLLEELSVEPMTETQERYHQLMR